MAQRTEPKDSPDDFPTPPWATRGLIEHVLEDKKSLANMSCLEPACGSGHMAKVLKEYFGQVQSADRHRYGYGQQRNFLTYPYETNAVDWVITNPPFRLAEEFVLRALRVPKPIGNSSGPCGRHLQCLMDANKIVVNEMQRHHMSVVFHRFATAGRATVSRSVACSSPALGASARSR
jgi:hypothetical protein